MTLPLSHLSASLADTVAAARSALVAVHGGSRSHTSGFFWKPGLIVTAEEALVDDEVEVTLADGPRVSAAVVGRDPSTDVALLRVEAPAAASIDLHAHLPRVGELAVAVGAHDASPMAALGMVSVVGEAWRSMRGGQIDARLELDLALRPRLEGGAVIGADGRAIGMIVFGPRRRVLVIPTQTVVRVATELERHGRIARGYLGLALQPVTHEPDNAPAAIVMGVDAEGPGAAAGIKQGDIVVRWNGQSAHRLSALLQALGPASIGGAIDLELSRGGVAMRTTVTVAERPEARAK